MTHMRALVTGAAGFLGRRLVTQLQARGAQVRALVRGEAPFQAGSVEVVRGDATDRAVLLDAVRGCTHVFHLAGVRRAIHREEFLRVNAESTRLLLEVCLEAAPDLARFVLAGSLSAAGPSTSGKREEDGFDPQEWYGESKAEAERIGLSYADRLPVTVARPPRIMGPGDRENLFFFRIVRRGWLVAFSGPARPLSFIDVDDCARGFLVLAEHPAAVGQAFFLASAARTDVEELQREVARALQVSPRVVRLRPWMLRAAASLADLGTAVSGRRLPLNRKLATQVLAPGWACDPSKARRLLGFEACVPLSDSIDRAARWYREQGWL
jgi:nucleoside-diphosphate-sugar epimerase